MEEFETQTGVVVAEEAQVVEPSMFRVIMYNDDYTPMDFVVTVLQKFFYLTKEESERIMHQIHTKGQAVCGVYARDVAETKVDQVCDFASNHEYPLLCDMEPVD